VNGENSSTVKGNGWGEFANRHPSPAVLLGSTGLAIAYGIAHDLVTAHVAVQHFTVHHVRIVPSESPMVMALLWGVIATWWFGAGAGLLFALASQVGNQIPRLSAKEVLRAEFRTLIGVWVGAMIVLIGIYLFGVSVFPDSKKATALDWRGDIRLVAVAITHQFTYLANAVAALALTAWILVKRVRLGQARQATLQQPD